jgi:phosphoglycerate dehydrogenase-like enzyme
MSEVKPETGAPGDGPAPAGQPGPGHGPGGSPRAIAVSPLFWGRHPGPELRERIAAAAPGARIVLVSAEGVTDEPLDDVEVLLRGWTIGDDALDRLAGRAPMLRWIHSASVGVESVLTPIVRLRGITVTNGRDVYSKPIAEFVLTMILAICHRLPQLFELQRERAWQPLEALELSEVTVGLAGLGSIGREVARLLEPFGAQILAIRRTPGGAAPANVRVLGGVEALPELMSRSDFVVLALPLTPETESVIDEERLAVSKPGLWLINIARGALVDERALIRALRDGQIGGAVLDALRQEPLPETSTLYRLSNCIVTPHTSWSSSLVLGRTIDVFCDNLRRYRSGEPLRFVVDPEAGY